MPRDLEDLVYQHEKDISRIDAWISTREKLSDRAIVDIDELKLNQREKQVTQRVIAGLGGFAGTLIITLIVFIATH